MIYLDKQTGYKWRFKSYQDGQITLYNAHEGRHVTLDKSVLKSQYSKVVPRDRNGFPQVSTRDL